MLAQRLRHRVTIKRLTTTVVDDEAASEAWTSIVDSEPAEIIAHSGKEYEAAAATQSRVDTRITIRRRSDLMPSDRVEHEGNFYDIVAILPDPTLRRHITLLCHSGVTGG